MNDGTRNGLEIAIREFVETVNLNVRVCENTEEVDGNDAVRYNHACDYPENSDPGLVVEELRHSLQKRGGIEGKRVLEIGPGPGYLCRELMNAGAAFVVGVVPSKEMIAHVNEKYHDEIRQGRMRFVFGSVYSLHLEFDTAFDLVVCQNSLHQLFDPLEALRGMVKATAVGGEVHVFDFRRDISTEQLVARIGYTKREIWQDLANSICAALTKREVRGFLDQIPGITFNVSNARNPADLSARARSLIAADPVPHHKDYALSQKIVAQRYM